MPAELMDILTIQNTLTDMPNVTETHTCGRHVYLIDQTSEKVETVQERVTSGIIAHQTVVEMQSYVHEQT